MLPPSLLSGDNAAFLDDAYRRWLVDPTAVDAEWGELFESLDGAPSNGVGIDVPAPDRRSIFNATGGTAPLGTARTIRRQRSAAQLIRAYRVRGHFLANIDPLMRRNKRGHPELSLGYYGLTDEDLGVEVDTDPLYGLGERATVGAIVDHLRATYAGDIGAEFMNIDDMGQKIWVQEQLETIPGRSVLSPDEERRVFRKLCDAENFERMLHVKFPGTKRFSIEGGETLVPLLDMVIGEAARLGVAEIVVGMAHRGRLNVLSNVLEKPARLIVDEFQDSKGLSQGSGDVKYHLGYSADTVTVDGHSMHLSLTPNPSHLEAVDPVVEGRVRAKQDRLGTGDRTTCMPLLLHGDAAFVGQGLVMETFQLSELAGYRTGGTIHVVVNNQIGFTTPPSESRSTPYATDAARMMGIPIFHVNGEVPRAVAAVVRMAVAWRQKFSRDVVIDMYCYRKHGHNEGDEPSFTQPLMYEQIRARPTPRQVYQEHLTRRIGSVGVAEADAIYEASRAEMDALAAVKEGDNAGARVTGEELMADKGEDPDLALYTSRQEVGVNAAVNDTSPMKGRWLAYQEGLSEQEADTGVPLERLVQVLTKANEVPDGFRVHAKVERLVAQRLACARGERPIDWSVAEQAAFGTLVTDGYSVRLSGQDCGRGTFSQRHAVWTDGTTGADYYSLDHLDPLQASFKVIDSSLSEAGVLGFEFGYSLDTPDGLVCWEAQFGDFANGAQVIIDQFVTSSEQKWGRLSGLVMLLPHGYAGQGPEHSSAKLERWLMACAQDNLQVANCTTPSNYFHLLRRQMLRQVRKPLILMSPKSLLRHADATSTLDELANGWFQKVILDPEVPDPSAAERVVFCSGKVYYELARARAEAGLDGRVVIHRVELLYPFPADEIRAAVDAAPATAEVVWCQEEPQNMGAWTVLSHWLYAALPQDRRVRYVGRPPAASPATGSHSKHRKEQAAVLEGALTL